MARVILDLPSERFSIAFFDIVAAHRLLLSLQHLCCQLNALKLSYCEATIVILVRVLSLVFDCPHCVAAEDACSARCWGDRASSPETWRATRFKFGWGCAAEERGDSPAHTGIPTRALCRFERCESRLYGSGSVACDAGGHRSRCHRKLADLGGSFVTEQLRVRCKSALRWFDHQYQELAKAVLSKESAKCAESRIRQPSASLRECVFGGEGLFTFGIQHT